MRREARKQNIIIGIIVLLLVLTIGYATLTTNLTISGTSKINNSTWNVHFNNPSEANTGSVAIDTSTYADAHAARKDSATQVSFNVLLSEPGDFYEFTVPVQNEGSIDAMIDEVTSTIQIGTGTVTTINSSADLPAWLDYNVTYSDGTAIAAKQKLDHGTTETYKVRVEFKKDITNAQFESAVNKELHLTFGVEYVQADNTAVAVPHPSFDDATSWETIISAIQSGNTSSFEVGDTKTVDMGTLGTHTLRVANNSTPAECSTQGFSQTACGFVLEFADIITTHQMNPQSYYGNSNGEGNRGGWEYSDMRAYLNSGKYLEGETGEVDYTSDGIYNALPTALKNAIINTTVVSGHGNKDSTNFTTIDKLYLLSTHEVWEDVDGNTSDGIDYYDTGYNNTRQLDYYKNNNVTMGFYGEGNYSLAIKKYNNSNTGWWLRSASTDYIPNFHHVYNTGRWYGDSSNNTNGVSPAFRIA